MDLLFLVSLFLAVTMFGSAVVALAVGRHLHMVGLLIDGVNIY